MSFPLINPYQQFFDSSGDPLVSGTIEFRNPTTNALINSYPTADDADAQTNANDNPLTLDSYGAATTGLYLEDGTAYKVILKDLNGATITTQDDVLCPSVSGALQTAAELANSITPTDTSYEPGDVRRYGALIDGSTDDTTAFNNAVQSGHPAFCITPGTANIATTIVMDGDKQLSLCAGFNLSRLTGTSTAPILHIYGQNNTFDGKGANIRHQLLLAHLSGIVLVGPDPAETAGGTTDVDCYRNRLYNFKIIGPKQTIAQDGSPGLYIHSLKRKAGSYTMSNYYSEFYSIHVVNCDVGIEFSSDANAHSIHGCYINQWQESAITFNGSYGNCLYGVKMEKPLAISGTGTTKRYAINLLAQNGSTIETGTDSGYGIDAAFNNVIRGYAELPQYTDAYVALMTQTDVVGNSGRNVIDITGQLVGGVGTGGNSNPDAVSNNDVYTQNVSGRNRPIQGFGGYQFRTLDNDPGDTYGPSAYGSSFGTDQFKMFSGRMASLTEQTTYDVITVDNVGPTTMGCTLKLSWIGRDTANFDMSAGETSWLCAITNDVVGTPVKFKDFNTYEGANTWTWSVAESAGTDANSAKFILQLNTGNPPGTGIEKHYMTWKVEILHHSLEGAPLDWDADITIQNGD